MPVNSIDERRASFRSVGDEYERVRPQYPRAAVTWIAGGEPGVVVDLGCGPGKLTSQLAEMGHTVVGVDPSLRMLKSMRAKRLPAVCGAAEAIPLRDACADLVTAAQAFHWFDHVRAVPEMRRVARTEGRIGLLWNFRDERVEWVASLRRLIGTEDVMPGKEGATEDFHADVVAKLEHDGAFGSVERKVFAYEQELTEDGLVDLVGSRSYVAILDQEDREEVLSNVRQLCRRHPQLRDATTFTLPYVTTAFRAKARS